MPEATVAGTRCAYAGEGSGPLLFFGHGLLATREMLRARIAALSDSYPVFDRDDSTDRTAAIRTPTLVRIPAAGHHSALENPEPVTAAIARFPARL